MNTIFKAVVALSSVLMLLGHAEASENETTTSTKPGVVVKVEKAVKHGAKSAAHGIKRGGEAAAHGIDRGVQATKRTAHRVAKKLDIDKPSASSTDK